MSERLQDVASGRTDPKTKGFGSWIAGRANRREYWLWVGPAMVASVVLGVFSPVASWAVGVLILLVWIRRLHDLGHSGWWVLAINVAVAIAGGIVAYAVGGELGVALSALPSLAAIVALGVLPGEAGPNEYGPVPGQPPDVAETFS